MVVSIPCLVKNMVVCVNRFPVVIDAVKTGFLDKGFCPVSFIFNQEEPAIID